jgi:transposase, IS5 family
MPGETATKSNPKLERAPAPDELPELLGPKALKIVPVVNRTPSVMPISAALSKKPIASVVACVATIEPGTGAQPGTSNACARSLTFVKGDTVKAFASPARRAKEANTGINDNLKEPLKKPAKIHPDPRLRLERMSTHLQLGFTDYEQIHAKKRTRRQRFLDEMETTVPWEAFLALIEPVYHKPSSKGGRPPIPLEVMLRIHLLQQWFTLSDPLMEEMLIDTPCFRRFAGIETMEGRIPDETTILNFRHLLEEHRIAEQILEGVNQMLSERGVMLREGTILDATIINAPSSTKNKAKERDPEMHSVAKGKQWFFGMRCHIGVDAASGLVHSVESTAANVHELNTAAERLHGDERLIYGDAGHIGIEKRNDFQDCEAEFRIAMKPGQRRVLPETPEGRLLDLIETAKAHFRAKVEHPFRIIKCQFGFRKVFYRGIRKNDLKLKLLFALANLWMVRERIPDPA